MIIKFKLTKQEDCVLSLLNRGISAKGIANKLEISQHTVSGHMKCIYLKLDVKSRSEAQYKINKYVGLIANEEKADRAAELLIANEEKADRAAELVIANIKIEQSEIQLLSSLNALAIARD